MTAWLRKLYDRPQIVLIAIFAIGFVVAFLFLPTSWSTRLLLLFMAANGTYFMWKEWTKP